MNTRISNTPCSLSSNPRDVACYIPGKENHLHFRCRFDNMDKFVACQSITNFRLTV